MAAVSGNCIELPPTTLTGRPCNHELPAARRSATLNLIYLPLYLGGIAGPAIGAGVVTGGLRMVFFVAAGILAGATVLAVVFARRQARLPEAPRSRPEPAP